MFLRFVAVVAALAAMPLTAQAATIDFTEVSGGNKGNELVLSNAVIAAIDSEIFVFEPGDPAAGPQGAVCAFVRFDDRNLCTGSLAIGFPDGPVSDLRFEIVGFNPGDIVTASIFADATSIGSLIETREITASGFVSFSGILPGIPGIARIEALFLIDGGSTAEGVAYRNFSFTPRSDTPVIPLPAALPIMLTALGAFGLVRRRRA